MGSDPQQIYRSVLDRLGASEPLVLGFSGGSDSLALLVRLLEFGRQTRRPVHALVVNHRISSGADAQTARALDQASELGAKAQGLVWGGASLVGHAQARSARYALLAGACRELGAQHLLLAHTRDDQHETFLLRVLANSGPTGLAVMGVDAPYPLWPEGASLRVLRPVLHESRAKLRQFLTGQNLSWIDDPANQDHRYARVRMREHLARLHKNGFRAEMLDRAIQRFQALARDQLAALAPAIQQSVRFDRLGFANLAVESVAKLDSSIRQLLLEKVMLAVSGAGRCKHRGLVLEQLWQQVAIIGQTQTKNGCVLQVKSGQLWVMREPGAVCGRGKKPGLRVEVKTAGQPVWFDARWQIKPPMSGTIVPLGNCREPLSPAQLAALKAIPSFVRQTLPVLLCDGHKPNLLCLDAPQTISFAGAARGLETGTCFA
ncbi:MAG: tRNA lysidine(34) synthetase TilS [Robiginitomaculum sp.]|nr:MAG: tRNA lysidine(34) synthetase TilS [Robiginitomaculum sp.]